MFAESIRNELAKVFTVPQAEILAQVVVKAHDTLATRSDMHDLRVAMTELAEQQKLTSAEVRDLAEQQKLTSAEVRDLAEQQKLTSAEVRDLAEQQKLTSAEVRDLAEQQKLTSAEVRDLAEQQKLTSAEVRRLAVQFDQTIAEVRDLTGQHRALAKDVHDLTRTVADLAGSVRTLDIRTNKTAGWALEWVVGNRLPAFVGRQIKRCRVVGPMDLIESLENATAFHSLTEDDLDQLRRADLIATGTADGEKVYLVGEVSFTADNDDILRSVRRAAVLRKVGERAQPFVACDVISPISMELASREGVWVILDGRLLTSAA